MQSDTLRGPRTDAGELGYEHRDIAALYEVLEGPKRSELMPSRRDVGMRASRVFVPRRLAAGKPLMHQADRH